MSNRHEPPEDADLAPISDAAEYLRVNRRTIRNWISEGKLAGYSWGPRIVRVDMNEVRQLGRRIPTA